MQSSPRGRFLDSLSQARVDIPNNMLCPLNPLADALSNKQANHTSLRICWADNFFSNWLKVQPSD